MEKQNVTVSLPKLLLKKAKIIAARREQSLSEFLRDSLNHKVREATGFAKARSRQLKFLKEGFDLGTKGEIKVERGKLHERR